MPAIDNPREKIVIVDEDGAERETLRAMLDTSGYDVATFNTASEGLEAIHSGEVNLLLMGADVRQAPDLSGSNVRDTIATIRGSAATEMIRVILLVGSAPEQRIEALSLGAAAGVSRHTVPGGCWAAAPHQYNVF